MMSSLEAIENQYLFLRANAFFIDPYMIHMMYTRGYEVTSTGSYLSYHYDILVYIMHSDYN